MSPISNRLFRPPAKANVHETRALASFPGPVVDDCVSGGVCHHGQRPDDGRHRDRRGVVQIGFEKLRGRPVETMQWLSMAVVIVFGGASLLTQDNRFIMI